MLLTSILVLKQENKYFFLFWLLRFRFNVLFLVCKNHLCLNLKKKRTKSIKFGFENYKINL